MRGFLTTTNGIFKLNYYSSLTFEVGKTYTINAEDPFPWFGFKFYTELKDAIYSENDLMIFEADVLGEVHEDNSCYITNKLKVLRVVEPREYQEWYKANKDGFILYHKLNNYEESWEYDEFNNMTFHSHKDYNGEFGHTGIYSYDSNKNLVMLVEDTYYWTKYEYDKNNNCIKEENDLGMIYLYEYNESNKLIKTIVKNVVNCDGTVEDKILINTYDNKGRLLTEDVDYKLLDKNLTVSYKYDDADNIIFEESNDGNKTVTIYDDKNRIVYLNFKYNDIVEDEILLEYDDKDNVISYKDLEMSYSIVIE